MRLSLLVLLVVFFTSVANAERLRKKPSGLDKVLRSMFQSRKTVVVRRPAVRPIITKRIYIESPKSVQRTFNVDRQWLARYWELEATWGYWIPEDDQIKFKDGKYIVPIVVFKHCEDMAKTPRRDSANAPSANSPLE